MEPADPLVTLRANFKPAIVRSLRNEHMTRQEYIGLYSQVYAFVISDSNNRVHELGTLYATVRNLLADRLGEIVQQVSVYHGDALLQRYLAHWNDFRFSSKVIRGMCDHMDHYDPSYHRRPPLQGISTVYGICLLHWKNLLLKPLELQIMHAVLDMYAADRRGEVIDSQLLRGVIHNFVELDLDMATDARRNADLEVYRTFFEEKFLDETKDYYVRESGRFLQENSFYDYVTQVHTCLAEEKDRATKYLHESTLPELNTVLEEALIIHHSKMLDNKFTNLLTEEKFNELKIMDDFLRRIPGRVLDLHRLLRDHIGVHGGAAIARDAEQLIKDPRAFVLLLLEQYDRYFKIVTDAFDRDLDYSNAMDLAMKALVNNNAVTVLGNGSREVAQLTAHYYAAVLRKSMKNPDDAELDEELSRVMIILRYVHDQDVVQKYFERILVKCLVGDVSARDDWGAAKVTKLKTMCGYSAKLERMYQDTIIAKDLNDAFQHSREQQVLGGVTGLEFTVQVLSSGDWPISEKINLSLPTELERPLAIFGEFYRTKHPERTLRWLYCVSRGELLTSCFPTRHILQVSAYQAAMLLLFNEMDAASMGQLVQLTNCKLSFLAQVVMPFVKLDILRVAGKSAAQVKDKDLTEETTEVTLNLGFESEKMRLKLNKPLRVKQKQEEEATARHIDADRSITIQAAIVRVMKTRKTIKHQSLIGEVITQLASRFKPSISLIKKCIEILIEKEYMKRDEDDQTQYTYIA